MRHDPASAAVVVMLKALKLYGMAQAVGDLIEQGAPAFGAAVPMLSQLLKAEMAEREVRSTWPGSTSHPARPTKLWFGNCMAASLSTALTTSS